MLPLRLLRKLQMRLIHLIWGILVLIAFAASGQAMLRHVPPMRLLSDDVRLMYRSRHIYLFGSGIANVLLGLYVAQPAERCGAGFFSMWVRCYC